MALHWAVKVERSHIASSVIHMNSINHINNAGYTQLMLATRRGYGQILDRLQRATASWRPDENSILHLACQPTSQNHELVTQTSDVFFQRAKKHL